MSDMSITVIHLDVPLAVLYLQNKR